MLAAIKSLFVVCLNGDGEYGNVDARAECNRVDCAKQPTLMQTYDSCGGIEAKFSKYHH